MKIFETRLRSAAIRSAIRFGHKKHAKISFTTLSPSPRSDDLDMTNEAQSIAEAGVNDEDGVQDYILLVLSDSNLPTGR